MDQFSDLHHALSQLGHVENGSIHDGENIITHVAGPKLHVEVCQNSSSTANRTLLKQHVTELFKRHSAIYGDFTLTEFDSLFLSEHVCSVSIRDTDLYISEKQVLEILKCTLHLHVFQLHEGGPGQEELDDEQLAAAQHWLLPSRDFDGMWENLVFDTEIKANLLQYAETTLLFSDRNIDSNIIAWNRVILLHGPPGTGKTSLCKALAQKLSIHLSDRYNYGQLIEINSHSLFSKWFSESGKLVMKMFQKIQELIDDREALVCVLIDEVESLTAARKASLSGSEPSDAIRVVNALLTQIDQIKRNPNVIILTTSNITGAIDLAFVDRADIKQYIGPPSPSAIYKILHSCIAELIQKKIICPAQQIIELRMLKMARFAKNNVTQMSLLLYDISVKAQGLSGRTLRKLPFIAHAVFIQTATVTLEDFMAALSRTVDRQFEEIQALKEES